MATPVRRSTSSAAHEEYKTTTVTIGPPAVMAPKGTPAALGMAPGIDFAARQEQIGVTRRHGGPSLSGGATSRSRRKPANVPPTEVD
jgi:hypothetical protein